MHVQQATYANELHVNVQHYLMLGDHVGTFNRWEMFKRERRLLITVTSSTKLIGFQQNYQQFPSIN